MIAKDIGILRDELIEEDLTLRQKLENLEAGRKKVKALKPTLQEMERELDEVSSEVKLDKKEIEIKYEKLKETRRGFSITC